MDMETNRIMIENNQITISGEIVSNFELSHEIYGEGFYAAQLASERESGIIDTIPIIVSERLADIKADWTGQIVCVDGQFRSYNKHNGNKNQLILSVFARDIATTVEREDFGCEDKNAIFLDGYICKQPICRKTPLGREIADIFLAVNRPYGKSDYIPCIAWGRNARFAESLEVGTRLKVWGRIQSREYQKKISDDEYETRTAYEMSVSKMEVVEETEE